MLSAVETPVASSSETNPHEGIFEDCLLRTADAAYQSKAASEDEIQQAMQIARASFAQNHPADLLETLARVQGHDEEHLSRAITALGDRIANTMPHTPALIPFAGKLIAPSAFYESFDQIHRIARVLLSPVIYAEDTDAIGTASINPIASAILAERIHESVAKRVGIRPFITVARMDYENWTFLTRKHFEL
jgi:hypothetical protein